MERGIQHLYMLTERGPRYNVAKIGHSGTVDDRSQCLRPRPSETSWQALRNNTPHELAGSGTRGLR